MVTPIAGDAGDASRDDMAEQVRRTVKELLGDSGLHICEQRGAMVISNPDDYCMGEVAVEFIGGVVAWERPVFKELGILETFTEDSYDKVTAEMIIRTLTEEDRL